MKRFLIGLLLVSFLVSAEPEKKEVGRYQIATTTYISPKTGKLYIVETVIDTKTGDIVKRQKFYYTKYKKIKK
jgi:hypothetical protein